MRSAARVVAAASLACSAIAVVTAPAGAQTGGLEAPSLWLLLVSLAQIVGAAALVVFFITRKRTRSCPRCGQRLARDTSECTRCGRTFRRASEPSQGGS